MLRGGRRGRMHTSICCLPLVSPLSRLYMVWSSWILILDMTYTAFLVRPAPVTRLRNHGRTSRCLPRCEGALLEGADAAGGPGCA